MEPGSIVISPGSCGACKVWTISQWGTTIGIAIELAPDGKAEWKNYISGKNKIQNSLDVARRQLIKSLKSSGVAPFKLLPHQKKAIK